jgi:hypothetical protein
MRILLCNLCALCGSRRPGPGRRRWRARGAHRCYRIQATKPPFHQGIGDQYKSVQVNALPRCRPTLYEIGRILEVSFGLLMRMIGADG